MITLGEAETRWGGLWRLSSLSLQLFYKSNTIPKLKFGFKKNVFGAILLVSSEALSAFHSHTFIGATVRRGREVREPLINAKIIINLICYWFKVQLKDARKMSVSTETEFVHLSHFREQRRSSVPMLGTWISSWFEQKPISRALSGGQPEASALRWQREVHTSGPGSHVLKAQDGREGISSPILPLLRLRAARGHSFHGRHFALAWRAELRPWEAILRLHLWLYLRCGLQERCSVPNVWISKGVPFVQPHLCPLPTLISNVPPFLPFFVACYLTISCVEF